MQIANQLKALSLGAFPCAVSWDATKRKWSKRPITVDREPWADTARRPINDPAVRWAGCTVCGVPVPEGVVILDLDTYKPGCSPQMAATVLGAAMPWEQALIQTTIGGGSHYAFRVPADWAVRQTDNIGGPDSGIDTRVGGKGFICTGEGYQPAGTMGVFRLAYPDSLPVLPDACRPLLEQVAPAAPQAPLPGAAERDVDQVTAALAYLDPTTRQEWFAVGCALKHYFHDDERTGYELWDKWSAGEFWDGGCPAGYAPDTQADQWSSIKLERGEGTINSGTLFFKAMRAGWHPPARMNVAAAFGVGAADASTFDALVQRIHESGTDSTKIDCLLRDISASTCNNLQRLLLRNELKSALKDAKLLDKDLARTVDQSLPANGPAKTAGQYGKDDDENAEIFLQSHYPGGSLIAVRGGRLYAYTGTHWRETYSEYLAHQIQTAAKMSSSRTDACLRAVRRKCPQKPGLSYFSDVSPNHIPYANGVLDVRTGALGPHSPDYRFTYCLPYNFDPEARCPSWLKFLETSLGGPDDPNGERARLLQEWMGYLMVREYSQSKILLLLGASGGGKSTIQGAIRNLVGEENVGAGTLTDIAGRFYLGTVKDKTVINLTENPKSIPSNLAPQIVSTLKAISGGDPLLVDEKNERAEVIRIPARIVMAGNHMPSLFDDSGALSGRLSTIPFLKVFRGGDGEDFDLPNKIAREIEGVAQWAYQGLTRLRANGRFSPCALSEAETQFIRENTSPLSRFVDECCVIGDPNARITTKDLHGAYRAWCLANDEKQVTRAVFTRSIKETLLGTPARYGVHRVDGKPERSFDGVSLQAEIHTTADAFKPEIVK